MTWKKTDSVLNSRINHHGLGSQVAAGQILMEAERILPDLFTAISVNRGILHLELSKKNLKALKQEEGRLFEEINRFATAKKLPEITRIRLTYVVQ